MVDMSVNEVLLPKKKKRKSVNEVLVDELLIEILSRLSCKMAIRSKSVCKHWNSIISSPQFTKGLIGFQVGWKGPEKLSISEFRKRQLIISREADFVLSLDYLPCFQGETSPNIYIASSCSGLLLCYNAASRDKATYYVCNPVTKQWASIPSSPFPFEGVITRLGFVCDPEYNIDDKGGVILNPHCRFRVVRAFGSSEDWDPVFDVDVFSSETGEWTKSWISRSRVYTEGGTYSIVPVITYNNRLQFQVGRNIVVYDPFSDRVCGDVDPPIEATGEDTLLDGFCCSNGFLWACQLRNRSSTLYIWRLIGEDQSQRWNLERKVVLPKDTRSSILGEQCMELGRVLTLDPNNPNIAYLCVNLHGLIVLWNLEVGSLEVISKCRPKGFFTWANTKFLDLPLWPRSIPSFPHPNSQSVLYSCNSFMA